MLICFLLFLCVLFKSFLFYYLYFNFHLKLYFFIYIFIYIQIYRGDNPWREKKENTSAKVNAVLEVLHQMEIVITLLPQSLILLRKMLIQITSKIVVIVIVVITVTIMIIFIIQTITQLIKILSSVIFRHLITLYYHLLWQLL